MYGTLYTIYDEKLDELRVLDTRRPNQYVCCVQSYSKQPGVPSTTEMCLELLIWLASDRPEMCLAM